MPEDFEKSNLENHELEKQEPAVFENLIPEQVEVLKSFHVERVLEEHPQVIYCEYNPVSRDIELWQEGLARYGIQKPVVFVKRMWETMQWRERSEKPDRLGTLRVRSGIKKESEKIPPLNEAIEKLTSDKYRRILEKYPNVRFSRKWITDSEMGKEREHYMEEDDIKNLFPLTDFTGDRAVRRFPNYFFSILNVPESFMKRIAFYEQLEFLYQLLVEEDDKKESEGPLLFPCLQDINMFKNRWEEMNLSKREVGRDVLEQIGGLEKIQQTLRDYRDNFFPDKFQEMAQLQEEINTWLRSLKVPE